MRSQAPIACLRPLEARASTKRWVSLGFTVSVTTPQQSSGGEGAQLAGMIEPAVLLKLDLRGQGWARWPLEDLYNLSYYEVCLTLAKFLSPCARTDMPACFITN